MIKKAIAAFVFVFTVIVTAGCGDSATDISYATVVNLDGISGNDIAAKAWTGTADFAGKKGKKAGLFISQNTDESSCEAALNAAAKAGAGIIVSVGTDMEVPVYQASGSQGKKKFILIGGSTRQSVDAQDSIRDNTICIAFASEQEGFLAGYGAVTEGYTDRKSTRLNSSH